MECKCHILNVFNREEGEEGSLEPQLFKCPLCEAAPELYEALREAREELRRDRRALGIREGDSLLTAMNKAIAKVGGK